MLENLMHYDKEHVAICSFLRIRTPPLHGGSEKFFLCKVSKNKRRKRFSFLRNDFFRFFDFHHGKCPFVIWTCLKMLKIFETSFEIWCVKIAFWHLSTHPFAFEEFLGRLRCEKNLTPIATL